MKTSNLDQAGTWLRRHGFTDASPTPLLAARLAVRRRTQLGAQATVAATILAVALTYKHSQREAAAHGFGLYGLPVLMLVMVGLVAVRYALDWWVRRTDRQWEQTLPRRVTYPVRLGWRSLLGLPRAAITATAFLGAVALAMYALSIPDGTARYAAVVLLIAVCGVAVGMVVQLRHVLTRPVVADDELSLDADLVMRVEDAKDAASPALLWIMPISSVIHSNIGWWNYAWSVFVALSLIAFAVVSFATVCRGTTARSAARQATGVTVSR